MDVGDGVGGEGVSACDVFRRKSWKILIIYSFR